MVQPLIPIHSAADLVNSLAKQHTGEADLVSNDLSNIVDFGRSYDNLTPGTKEIVKSGMVGLVTQQLFLTQNYTGNGVDIIRSRKEYGAEDGIIQINRPKLNDAIDDSATYDPDPGSSSDPFIKHPQDMVTTYFQDRFQFRFEWTIADRWLTGMFLSAEGFNSAVSAIDQQIRNSLALRIDGLTMSAIRGSIAHNLTTAKDKLGGAGTNTAINLLAGYNAERGVNLKASAALGEPEFLRYAVHRISLVRDYMKMFTRNFNEQGVVSFLEDENLLVLSQFKYAVQQYLQSDTFNKELLELPSSKSVPMWKSSGNVAGAVANFEASSRVADTIAMTDYASGRRETVDIDTSGVVATLYNTQRLGIHNLSFTSESQRDPQALSTNHFLHSYGQTVVDTGSSGVTFYVKDPA